MLVVALWIMLSFAMRNGLVKSGSDKLIAAILISPIAILSWIIAFFEISELALIPFVAKLVQSYILDEPKKYQIMIWKSDPVETKLKQLARLEPDRVKNETKTTLDMDKRWQIEKQDIL